MLRSLVESGKKGLSRARNGFSSLGTALNPVKAFSSLQQTSRFHLASWDSKAEDRKTMLASVPKKDEGTEGETAVNIDHLIQTRSDMFPTAKTPTALFNGIPFKDIPICNVKASRNNTVITMSDPQSGEVKMIRSCGIEGFKNTRKGTNVAAQATAITFGLTAVNKGYNSVRLRVSGLGPGRMSAIKGLQMGGLNIVSVTDNTPVSWFPPRPRKQRRL